MKDKSTEKTKEKVKELTIDGNKHPEAAKHAKEAIDNGASNEGVVDRAGSSSRRKENTKNVNTEKGKDRDEFPPAVIKTEGGVSVKLIPSGDNRGAGGSLGQQLRNVPDNARVVIKVIEPIKKN